MSYPQQPVGGQPPYPSVVPARTRTKARVASGFLAVYGLVALVVGLMFVGSPLYTHPGTSMSGLIVIVMVFIGALIVALGVLFARGAYGLWRLRITAAPRAMWAIWIMLVVPAGILKTAIARGLSYVGVADFVFAIVLAAALVGSALLVTSAVEDLSRDGAR
jgi:hypothetical protein